GVALRGVGQWVCPVTGYPGPPQPLTRAAEASESIRLKFYSARVNHHKALPGPMPEVKMMLRPSGDQAGCTLSAPIGCWITRTSLPSAPMTRMRKGDESILAETASRRPSGLQNGCCQFPRAVIAHASDPSALMSQTWKTPVPSSADKASVLPSGDHQGWRLSPGLSVTCRAPEPSGRTVQMLIAFPPLREK